MPCKFFSFFSSFFPLSPSLSSFMVGGFIPLFINEETKAGRGHTAGEAQYRIWPQAGWLTMFSWRDPEEKPWKSGLHERWWVGKNGWIEGIYEDKNEHITVTNLYGVKEMDRVESRFLARNTVSPNKRRNMWEKTCRGKRRIWQIKGTCEKSK